MFSLITHTDRHTHTHTHTYIYIYIYSFKFKARKLRNIMIKILQKDILSEIIKNKSN